LYMIIEPSSLMTDGCFLDWMCD